MSHILWLLLKVDNTTLDTAVLTGGQLISEEVGLSLDTASLDMLGTARKITIDKENTTIVAGDNNKLANSSAQSSEMFIRTGILFLEACRPGKSRHLNSSWLFKA